MINDERIFLVKGCVGMLLSWRWNTTSPVTKDSFRWWSSLWSLLKSCWERRYKCVYQNWVLHLVSICYISECALQAPYSHHSLHPSLNLSICHLFFWGIPVLTCTYLLAQPGLYFTCIVPLGKECGMILNKS